MVPPAENPVLVMMEAEMPRNAVYRQRAALCAKDRLLRCVSAVHRWFRVHMIFQEEFPRNKGKPELFGGCAAFAVISLFLRSVSFFTHAEKKNTPSQQPVGFYYPLFLTALLPSHHLESCCFFPGWWTVNTVWSLFTVNHDLFLPSSLFLSLYCYCSSSLE